MRHIELQVLDSTGHVVARVSDRAVHAFAWAPGAMRFCETNRKGDVDLSIHAHIGIISGALVSFGDVEAQGVKRRANRSSKYALGVSAVLHPEQCVPIQVNRRTFLVQMVGVEAKDIGGSIS